MNGCIQFGALLMYLFCIPSTSVAQTEIGTLNNRRKIIRAAIKDAQKHPYTIWLNEGETAQFRLEQKGIGLKSPSLDSNGNRLKKFNRLNGRFDPEFIPLTSAASGFPSIELTLREVRQTSGNYEVLLHKKVPEIAGLTDRLDALFLPWDNKENPGVAVAVISKGLVIYKKGFGMANLEYGIPITPETIFHIASVSKQFTIFALLLLEKEGKLTLDDDVRSYLPSLPDFGDKITLRHLASHTSGLRDQWNLMALAGWRLDDVITREQILKMMSLQRELNFKPGEEYLYCNTGFTLLAEVVARVSGISFAEFTRKHIFEPLRMNHTSFYDDHEKLIKNRAYSYYLDSTGYKKSVLNYATVGATSLMTTAEDISHWALNFRIPKVGDIEMINEMNTPARLNNGTRISSALGQFTGKYNGLQEIQHGGADAGYRSYFGRYPEQDVSIALLSNAAEFDAAGMAHKVADILFAFQVTPAGNMPLASVSNRAIPLVPDQKVLETYVGTYELEPDLFITITIGKGILSARVSGQAVMALIPLSDAEFVVDGTEAVISFLPEPNGHSRLMQLAQGGEVMDAHRVAEFTLTPGELAAYPGNYYSDELGTEYRILEIDGKLIARHHRHSDIELEAVGKDVFRSDTWFFRQLVFDRNEANKVRGCRISSGRVRNLRFQKLPNRNYP